MRLKQSHKRILITIAALLLAVAVVTYLLFRQPKEQPHSHFSHSLTGIDISAYTGRVDFEQMAKDSVHFVYMRATMGSKRVDKRMAENYQTVREKTNLPVGFYHFLHFDEDGAQQADHFYQTIKDKFYDMMPVVDVEDWSNPTNKTTAQRVKVVEDFIHRFESLTHNKVMIYTNIDGYKKYISGRFPDNPLWICDLQPTCRQPHLFWQYRQDEHFPWAKGDVDLNTFSGTPAELAFLTAMPQSMNPNLIQQKSLNIICDTMEGLNLYFPQYNHIDLVCGTMPSPDDDKVVFCAEAAFTGKELTQFSHTNIAGNHVSGGIYYKGYTCKENTGGFVWYEGRVQFPTTQLEHELKEAANHGGMGFGQVCIIHKGKRMPLWRQNDNYYRALCIKTGTLFIADSREKIPYKEFVNRLQSLGVDEALYLDMGIGWNHSWFRDNHNQVQEIFPHTHDYTTNWIVFRKE